MRFVWGSLVGLLLCGTIVYAGISSEDLEDGVLSSSEEDILRLLRSEQLMRAEDEEGTCDLVGNNTCKETNQACKVMNEGKETYICTDCLEGYQVKSNTTGECELKTCDLVGNKTCEKTYQACYDQEGQEMYRCTDCLEGYQVKSNTTGECELKTCDLVGNKTCEKTYQACYDQEGQEMYRCTDCLEGYQVKSNTTGECELKTCDLVGNKTCEKTYQACYDQEGQEMYRCTDCLEGYQVKYNTTGECELKTCDLVGNKTCEKTYQACDDQEGKEMYRCTDCLEGYQVKSNTTGECELKTCDLVGNKTCEKTYQACDDQEGKEMYRCTDCLEGYQVKSNTTGECELKTCDLVGNKTCQETYQACDDKEGKETYKCTDCLEGYQVKSNTTTGECELNCDCGEASCSFDKDGEKVCTCPTKTAYFDKKCIECDCGDTDKCELNEKGKKKTCVCGPKQALLKNKCKPCDCGLRLCGLQKNGEKICFCPDKMGFYKDTCVDCDCGETELCKVGEDGNKLPCTCEPGQKPYNEKCVHSCKSEVGKKCKEDFKICEEKEDGYTCGACFENYKENKGRCIKKCNDKDSKCKNNGICENDLCKCNKGYDGDFCENIPKCTDALKKTCENAKAVCVYDSVKDQGVCECKDKNFVFKADSCDTPKWCEKNPCKAGNCTVENNIGQCKCEEGHFFNYNAEKCEKINPCWTKKDSCGANQECNPDDGQCKCVSGFEWEDDKKKTCKDMSCSENNNPCFDDATCQVTGIANTVKCICKEHYFYDGSKCGDGGCFLNEKNCSSCPEGTKHNEKKDVCEIEDTSKSCTKNCGFGWCIKEDDVEKCVCDKNFVRDNEAGKCVLDESACASGEVDADGKRCNCTGIYKLSSNGITCERRTCEDPDIKAECEDQNAKCVTKWKGDVSHSCECETGYEHNPPPNGKCVSLCDIDNICTGDRTCYLKNEANEAICKCPPSFKYIETKDSCEPDSSEKNVILKGLPVKKAKYLKKNEIDIIKLNKDVIDAMNAIYFKGELDFALLYKYNKTDGNSIVCDVWLQFNENNMGNADRVKVVKAQSSILPPALELSDGEWQKKIKAEKMEFCSEEIKTNVCGQHTACKNKQCSCKGKGYREIKSSIRNYQGGFKSVFCEDIDECKESNECTTNTTCKNTAGDYFCKCKDGFKKVEGATNEENKKSCTDLCTPNPCKSGTCSLENNAVDCACDPGYGGSLCDREDENFKRANKNTVVVGAVLGTILGVVVILLAFYIRRQRKNSYSEDFTPPPRMDNAEMVERGRPMRGVNNRGYQN